MALQTPCSLEEPSRASGAQQVPAHARRARGPSAPPRLRPAAARAGQAPRRPPLGCILAAGVIAAALALDVLAGRAMSALLQRAARRFQGEALMVLLGVFTYFAGFAAARHSSPRASAAGPVRGAAPGPGARKVAGDAAGHGAARAAPRAKLPRGSGWEQREVDRRLLRAAREGSRPYAAQELAALVGACARLGDAEVALGLFDHMLKTGAAFAPESVSSSTASKFFKVVAHGLDDKRMQKDGVQFVRRLLAHGIEPSTHIQNQLIRSWKSKLPEHVVQMFVDLREKGVHLSATAYRCVMSAHERTEPAFTLQLYDEMVERDVKIDRVAFNAVLCACSHLGMTDMALELFEQMSALGLEANGKTYGALIRACTIANRAKEALHFFEAMRAAGFEPNCFAARDAINCCVNLGQLETAYELYRGMVQVGSCTPCDGTCAYILDACKKNGCSRVADRIRADMRKYEIWARNGDAIRPDLVSDPAHVMGSDTASE